MANTQSEERKKRQTDQYTKCTNEMRLYFGGIKMKNSEINFFSVDASIQWKFRRSVTGYLHQPEKKLIKKVISYHFS